MEIRALKEHREARLRIIYSCCLLIIVVALLFFSPELLAFVLKVPFTEVYSTPGIVSVKDRTLGFLLCVVVLSILFHKTWQAEKKITEVCLRGDRLSYQLDKKKLINQSLKANSPWEASWSDDNPD